MSKKLKKMAFRGLGRTKNWEKQLSDPSDEQKTGKNSFPTPWMSRKLEKTAFQPLGRAKNWKKQFSNPLEAGR